MAKNKSSRITITLECTNRETKNGANKKRGTFRYTTTKNRRNTPARIELKKFCPKSNCHQLFKEIK